MRAIIEIAISLLCAIMSLVMLSYFIYNHYVLDIDPSTFELAIFIVLLFGSHDK